MNIQRFSAVAHKYLSLFLAIQIVFWVVSGLFFSVFKIEDVRSETRMKDVPPLIVEAKDFSGLEKIMALQGDKKAKITLENRLEGPVIIVEDDKKHETLFDARTGVKLSPITQIMAQNIVLARLKTPSPIKATRLVTKESSEYRGKLPAWRVELNEPQKLAVYVSVDNGSVTARRSNLWRVYDTLWALHIMDWQNHEDFNHPLLIITTLLTLLSVIAGIILIPFRIRFKSKKR